MWVQYKVRSFCILVHNWCITCIKHWVQIPYFLTSDVLVVHSSSSNFSHSIALWTVEGQVRTNENRRNRAIWGHHCADFDLSTSSGSTNNTRTKWERLVKKLAGYIILSSSFFKNTFRYFIQFLVVRACETWDLGVVILPTVEIALWYARCCHIFITTPRRCNIFIATPRRWNFFTTTPMPSGTKLLWYRKGYLISDSILQAQIAKTIQKPFFTRSRGIFHGIFLMILSNWLKCTLLSIFKKY